VSSDGRVFPAAPSSVPGSRPFRGTGVLPHGVQPTVVPPDPEVIPFEIDYDGNLISLPGGPARTESVIDTDERHQVTDTTVFPYRAIAWLLLEFPNGSLFSCTGFFIDADTLATAGHCVYSEENGGWVTSITAYPGRNGASAPYGSAFATAVFAPSGWYDDGDHRYDYGAITLDTPLGNTVGWLGYGPKLDENVVKRNVRIFGYPADKPDRTMWGTRRDIKGVDEQKLYYKIDTAGGQSGSPVYGKLSNACQQCAFGIPAYGVGIEPYPGSNSGTRVSESVYANLLSWAAE
jgi:glutamyl endopeptidase